MKKLKLPDFAARQNRIFGDRVLPGNIVAEERESDSTAREAVTARRAATADDMDVSLLADSLTRTPWERMQANDDALRFADSLRAAMEKRSRKSRAGLAPG